MTRIIPFISEYFNPYLTIIPILLNPEPKTIKKEKKKRKMKQTNQTDISVYSEATKCRKSS